MKKPARLAHMGMHVIAFVVAAAVLIFSVSPRSLGQAAYGILIGTVTDTTGAAVPGATINVTNVGTNVTLTVQTNASGNYTVANLTPGNYKVSVTKTGFKTAIQENVAIGVGRSTTVNPTLEIGQVNPSSGSDWRSQQRRLHEWISRSHTPVLVQQHGRHGLGAAS